MENAACTLNQIVLGLESSCDETAAAIVTSDKKILSNLVLSQQQHAQTGGVVPEVAARAHLDHLDTLIVKAMDEAKVTFKDLAAIAVTAGPGLIGGVMVGAMTAKAMAAVHNIPLIAVNHLEGHALTARLTEDISFPYLLLLVSGGHCQLLIVKDVGSYTQLGSTIDDAAGECFDKTAKVLGLGYPGGSALEKTAASCTDVTAAQKRFALPRPMVGKPGCDFSFSGLKTAAKRMIETLKPEDTADFCAAFQKTVGDILCDRTSRAIDAYLEQAPTSPTLVVAGGVAANKTLRAMLEQCAAEKGLAFAAPPLKLCTDNAAMIAWAGVERLQRGLTDPIDFPVYPRWPLDPAARR
ncbi:MAG: tRNA (adenosine(37)-N6)-threonylcarbamoyltransferase complex transferase subunit TsaD [Alphaproteobacteria bacterium]|nr:tRNA (adenosine(37)-N6)-threonylcarbamoyltransferase complex transferase subunit TsaD [Alphaproteobacteria bacterium]